MKRDMGLIREILLQVEARPSVNDWVRSRSMGSLKRRSVTTLRCLMMTDCSKPLICVRWVLTASSTIPSS